MSSAPSPIFAAAIVGAGGFLGALARFGVARAWLAADSSWPFATLTVNLVGCFVIGVMKAVADRHGFDPAVTLLLFAGFLGAFTTFSTFSFDAISLARSNGAAAAAAYVSLSVAGGLLLTLAGWSLVR